MDAQGELYFYYMPGASRDIYCNSLQNYFPFVCVKTFFSTRFGALGPERLQFKFHVSLVCLLSVLLIMFV